MEVLCSLLPFWAAIVLAGLSTWIYQMYNGLGVTGDNWPVFWGFHETNFVFWIGISHAGTLISAILRMVLCHVAAARHALRRSDHGLRADDRRDISADPSRPAVAGLVADSVSQRARDLAELSLAAGVGFFRDQHVSACKPVVPRACR